MEIVLSNGRKIYENASVLKQIFDLVAEYLSIWESPGFIYIPLEW